VRIEGTRLAAATRVRWVTTACGLCVCLSAGWVQAAGCDIGVNDVGFGFLMPEYDCAHTIHADVTFAAYTTDWNSAFVRGSLEVGALEQIGGDSSHFHVGPMLEVAGSGWSADEFEQLFPTWEVVPRVRMRYWLPPGDDDALIVLDGAIGPVLAFSEGPLGAWVGRAGGYAELGLSGHGLMGGFVAVEYLTGDPLAGIERETRFIAGAKLTAGGFIIGVILLPLAYVCGQGGGC
jgi:hypothetical protein